MVLLNILSSDCNTVVEDTGESNNIQKAPEESEDTLLLENSESNVDNSTSYSNCRIVSSSSIEEYKPHNMCPLR